jgi:hypothetical protein
MGRWCRCHAARCPQDESRPIIVLKGSAAIRSITSSPPADGHFLGSALLPLSGFAVQVNWCSDRTELHRRFCGDDGRIRTRDIQWRGTERPHGGIPRAKRSGTMGRCEARIRSFASGPSSCLPACADKKFSTRSSACAESTVCKERSCAGWLGVPLSGIPALRSLGVQLVAGIPSRMAQKQRTRLCGPGPSSRMRVHHRCCHRLVVWSGFCSKPGSKRFACSPVHVMHGRSFCILRSIWLWLLTMVFCWVCRSVLKSEAPACGRGFLGSSGPMFIGRCKVARPS